MRLRIALATGVLLGLAATAGFAAKPAPTTSVTIKGQPDPVVYGHATTIGGLLRGNNHGGKRIELTQDTYPFDRFVTVAQTTTGNNGHYSFARRPLFNTRYQVQAHTSPSVQSPILTELVRIRVTIAVSDLTPARGQRVKFSGYATPPHVGRVVRIQRRTGGGFATIATTTLRAFDSSRSRYFRFRRIFASGVYRVFVTADADHAAGISAQRTITVH